MKIKITKHLYGDIDAFKKIMIDLLQYIDELKKHIKKLIEDQKPEVILLQILSMIILEYL